MPNIKQQNELICALATPAGTGALAIVRLSGEASAKIANHVTRRELIIRQATYSKFYDEHGGVIDQGIAIYFKAPASFTGEDVVEFHCHGNSLVTDLLLKTLCSLGARLATPGEFSLRAFLNNKIDLAQAEAIADLINSSTEQGVRTATKSMQGAFSQRVESALSRLIQMRIHIEAHLDFPDEEIDRQQSEQLLAQLSALNKYLNDLLQQAKSSERLQTGATIAIAGKPNAGKSSLLNVLAQSDVAIVTEVPGTTRDTLSADIEIQGIAVRLIDTAGLRDTKDIVEAKGIERAQQTLTEADLILWVTEVSDVDVKVTEQLPTSVKKEKVIIIHNKIDLHPTLKQNSCNENNDIFISAKKGMGIDRLIMQLRQRLLGDKRIEEQADTPFLARSRHVVALQQAEKNIRSAQGHLGNSQELELAAEDLRLAQQNLGEITGEFTPDDLLGKIFSEFCIGK